MKKLKVVLLDLDGTVYWGDSEVCGASDFVRHCNSIGIRCMFVTNRANRPPEMIRDQLRGYGIPCETKDVLTSAQATAKYLGRGSAYIIGEVGSELALKEQGIRVVTDPNEKPDAVVVSYDREFSYAKLSIACRWIGEGARFIATNPDRQLRLNNMFLPGTGSIVAAVKAATGVEPEMIGKPERRMFDIALEIAGCQQDEALAVGDVIDTDIAAAHAAGIPSVLLLTGLSKRHDVTPDKPQPTYIIENFSELTRLVNKMVRK